MNLINSEQFNKVLPVQMYTYVTRFNKTDRIVTFCISRNTKLKYSNHGGSFLLESSYIKFTA